MNAYSVTELGNLRDLVRQGKAFLHDALKLTSCEISVNAVPKGWKSPFNHKHKQNEEIYIFIQGKGKVTIDGQEIDVQEGTCIKVLPHENRALANTGNEDLCFICVQAKKDSLEQYAMTDGEIC